jgi:hypothetical protein
MKKLIVALFISVSALSFNANAALIATNTGLTDPQNIRDNVTLTDYGVLELQYQGFGVWNGFSNILPSVANVLTFDVPALDFQFSNNLITDLDGGSGTFTTMNQAFNIANFESGAFIDETFNRFRFQLVADVSDPNVIMFFDTNINTDVYVENIKYGFYQAPVEPTGVSEPGMIVIFLLGFCAIIVLSRRKIAKS